MGTLATLTVDLVAQSATLRADLAKANKSAKSWADKTRKHVSSAAKAFAGLSITGIAGLAAIYAQSAKSGDAVAKMADKIGILPEKLMALNHAAELTGVSIETQNMALQRMSRRVAEAAQGTGEAQGALKELGLDAKEFARLSPDEQFKSLADAMGGVSNQGDRVRLSMKLFDSEGVALVNTLALGRDGLNEVEREANALGLTLNRVDLAKIEAANDSFTRTGSASKAFGNQLAAQLAPIVEGVTNQFVDMAKEMGGFGGVATRVVGSVVRGFGFVADAVRGVRAVWKGLVAGVAHGIAGILEGLTAAQSGLVKVINAVTGSELKTSGVLKELADGFRLTASSLAEDFNEFALQPLPSKKIDAWVKDVQEKAQLAAEKVAADRNARIGSAIVGVDTGGAGGDTEKVVSLQKEKFRRLREAALEADGQFKQIEEMRYQRQLADIEKQKELLNEKGLLTQTLQQQFFQAEQDAQKIHEDKIQEIKQKGIEGDRAIAAARTQVYSDLAGVIAAGAEEGSKAQRAALAVQKAFALKESLLALQVAISKANSLGFPASIPAIAEAGIVGYGAINTIKGIAHSGMTNVPEEGTYLLNKGERVLQPSQNDDLKKFLAGGKNQGMNVVIHNYSDSKVSVNRNGQELEVIVKQVRGALSKDFENGTGLARPVQRAYGLTRRGVA